MTRGQLRSAARRILRAGLAAVEPEGLVRAHLRRHGAGLRIARLTLPKPRRLFVVAVGKAAPRMARAALDALGSRITSAIVIAPWAVPPMARTRSFVSGHPVPDAAGVRASLCVIRLLEQAEKDDLVVLLLSGGASALMPAPIEGVSLGAKKRVTRLLLARGATIAELNAVRKRLSRLKGGGFARLAAPARVVALVLSDVPGDDPKTIGSGPTVDDPRARTLARRAISKYLGAEEVPAGVVLALRHRPREGSVPRSTRTLVIGSGRTFARAAGDQAMKLGFRPRLLPDALKGEARDCGPGLVERFRALRRRGPACLIATGETVVKVRGKGRGGRNQELALSAVEALASLHGPIVLAAFGTDGTDGPSKASGGLVDDGTARRAVARGISIQEALDGNDSGGALERLFSLIVTGPTGTNVADVTVVVG